MSKMIMNLIHRADRSPEKFEALKFQQKLAHQIGLKTTVLVTYQAMFNKDITDYLKKDQQEYDDEIGIHLEGIKCDEFREKFKMEERALYLYSFEMKKKILTEIFRKFEEIFGFLPNSLGSYYLDARTLNWIKEEYPVVKTSIVSCFEEGVHMFAGNKNQWYLFSEGGPWGVYYPSQNNSFCPAKDADDAVDIVALPHLNRDMLLALTSRDDYFSSHPANIIRGKANNGPDSPYIYKFIDKWIEQLKYNQVVYYNVFVSPSWMVDGNNFEVPSEYARKMYKKTLEYLKFKVKEELVEDMTVNDFGEYYRKQAEYGAADINLWDDILCGSKRQMFWYLNPYFRIAVDPNIGGSICDLRPYAGQVDKNLGPDTENLANGNYPFLISAEHRGGTNGGSIHTCKINYKGKTVSLLDYRTQSNITQNGDETVLELDPIKIEIADLKFKLLSKYTFNNDNRIMIERKIEDLSEPDAEVELIEFHRGCWGTTQYPEDMRGIKLGIKAGRDKNEELISYNYQSRRLEKKNPGELSAGIAQVQSKITLEAINIVDKGFVEEGYLFRPFYTLKLKKTLKEGDRLNSCLKIEKI
jgi:hypothetical protein